MKKKDDQHEAKLKLGDETYTSCSTDSELATQKVSYKALHKTKYTYLQIPAGMHVVQVDPALQAKFVKKGINHVNVSAIYHLGWGCGLDFQGKFFCLKFHERS